MSRVLVFLGFFGCSMVSYAQGPFGYYEDALRFSQSSSSVGTTARMKAVGGAQTSLGGDLGSIVSNPAGLGFYNRSVFTLTPSLEFIHADTEYLGQNEEDSKANFNLANIGTAIHFGKGPYTTDKFKGGTLGISLSRMNSFHLDRSYRAPNDFNSIVDSFLQNSGSLPVDDLGNLAFEAYNQYLINPVFDSNGNIIEYETFIGFPVQSESIEQRGAHYQVNVAWGGNLDDRFYFGGGLGIQILNYTQRRNFFENDFVEFDNEGNVFADDLIRSITLNDELRVRGNGINLNVGAIFRPVDFVTLGVSYTSPSFMAFDEEGFFDLATVWQDGTEFIEIDEDGNEIVMDISGGFASEPNLFISEYSLRTPSRLAVGTSIFVGKNGFLTADLERVDYSNATINSADFPEPADNDEIEKLYQDVLNIRVGGEYRFDSFRLRAGYSIFPSPHRESDLQEQTNTTFGFGYRTPDYFLDFAVVNSLRKSLYVPYEVAFDQPVAESGINTTSVAVTFGVNF